MRLNAMSIPADTPDEVSTLPSSTQRALRFQRTRGPCWVTQSQAILFDVAGRPSSKPGRASPCEPVQTEVPVRAGRRPSASRPWGARSPTAFRQPKQTGHKQSAWSGALSEAPPRRRAALGLERAEPPDQRFALDGVHEEVLGVEAQLAVVAAELGHEGRPDRRRAAVDRPVELVVDRVLGHERHHAVQVVAVERLREADHQIHELLAFHARLLIPRGRPVTSEPPCLSAARDDTASARLPPALAARRRGGRTGSYALTGSACEDSFWEVLTWQERSRVPASSRRSTSTSTRRLRSPTTRRGSSSRSRRATPSMPFSSRSRETAASKSATPCEPHT